MSEYWGYHALINCSNCSDGILSKNNIIAFVKKLVEDIDMKAFGEPWVEHFATHDPSKGGFSLCQMIETSNITGHFVDATKECYIDVFSCKPFDVKDVEKCINDFFSPKTIDTKMIYRKAI